MVNAIRSLLKGFLLLPGRTAGREAPHLPGGVSYRACALRGYCNKDSPLRFMLLPGRDETEVLRHLRAVVVEQDRPPRCGRYEQGLNLLVFRGVFGSGGYDMRVRDVRLQGRVISVECDFEDPGDGIRTTPAFTQPTIIIPLKRLPPGRYQARLRVRRWSRSAVGLHEVTPVTECARFSFRVRS
jgi:hypothetical protein